MNVITCDEHLTHCLLAAYEQVAPLTPHAGSNISVSFFRELYVTSNRSSAPIELGDAVEISLVCLICCCCRFHVLYFNHIKHIYVRFEVGRWTY